MVLKKRDYIITLGTKLHAPIWFLLMPEVITRDPDHPLRVYVSKIGISSIMCMDGYLIFDLREY